MDTAWKAPIKYTFPCACTQISLVDVKYHKTFVITVQSTVWSSFVSYSRWQRSQAAGTQIHTGSDSAVRGFSPASQQTCEQQLSQAEPRDSRRAPNSWLMHHLSPSHESKGQSSKSIVMIIDCCSFRHWCVLLLLLQQHLQLGGTASWNGAWGKVKGPHHDLKHLS